MVLFYNVRETVTAQAEQAGSWLGEAGPAACGYKETETL
jgi:hypothetical protein